MRLSPASRAAARTTARRLAVAAASALLLVGPFTATAQADPVDELPAELVEAVQRDLQMSPEEYLERSARAQELGEYARGFRSERPADFAGAWINRNGEPVVAVTNSDAARKAESDGYTATVAPVSTARLYGPTAFSGGASIGFLDIGSNSPSPRLRGEGWGEGRRRAMVYVAAPHPRPSPRAGPDLLPIAEGRWGEGMAVICPIAGRS